MNLTPWRSRPAPLSTLQQEMNRVFEDFFAQPLSFSRPLGLAQQGAQDVIIPVVDMKEDEQAITVTAELPGIERDNIEISVDEGVLEIRGHKSEETKREQENYHMFERSYGSFSRRVMLPSEVDSEAAEAAMQDGVLTLKLPKTGPKAGKKTISIK
jgi:HSP20 family protein